MFSDAGPDVRWVGNERGEGSLTSWSLVDRARYVPGTPFSDELGEGSRLGADWVAAECDVSIRPGWFHRSSEDARVKSPETLFRLFEASVGRNCQLLLNVPPDTRGRIADPDVRALVGMRTRIDAVYGANLARGATATADAAPGDVGPPSRAVDGDPDTYWVAPGTGVGGTLTLALPAPVAFDRVVVAEPIALGQRIASFDVQADTGSGWTRIATGTTVGYKRILPVPPTTASRVRIAIHDARATPLVGEVGLYSTGEP
jgi:alpha-L-fucosidase